MWCVLNYFLCYFTVPIKQLRNVGFVHFRSCAVFCVDENRFAHCSNVYFLAQYFSIYPSPECFHRNLMSFIWKYKFVETWCWSSSRVVFIVGIFIGKTVSLYGDGPWRLYNKYLLHINPASFQKHILPVWDGTSPPICNDDIVYVSIHYLFYVISYFSIMIDFWWSASHQLYRVV